MQTHWTNPQIVQWCQYLLDSYAYWIKQELIHRHGTPLEQAERLFNSSFVVASHGVEDDPVLNYGNQAALNLWAMDWEQFTRTPSRLTAAGNINRHFNGTLFCDLKLVRDCFSDGIDGTGSVYFDNRLCISNTGNTN